MFAASGLEHFHMQLKQGKTRLGETLVNLGIDRLGTLTLVAESETSFQKAAQNLKHSFQDIHQVNMANNWTLHISTQANLIQLVSNTFVFCLGPVTTPPTTPCDP